VEHRHVPLFWSRIDGCARALALARPPLHSSSSSSSNANDEQRKQTPATTVVDEVGKQLHAALQVRADWDVDHQVQADH